MSVHFKKVFIYNARERKAYKAYNCWNDELWNLFTGEKEDLAQTRERFNEVFKKYTDLEKKKKVKKKRDETQETIAVCLLISSNLSIVVFILNLQ